MDDECLEAFSCADQDGDKPNIGRLLARVNDQLGTPRTTASRLSAVQNVWAVRPSASPQPSDSTSYMVEWEQQSGTSHRMSWRAVREAPSSGLVESLSIAVTRQAQSRLPWSGFDLQKS
jgi:hypothetical protein